MARIYALLCFLISTTVLIAQQEFKAVSIPLNQETELLKSRISQFQVYEIDTKAIDGHVQKSPSADFSLVFDQNKKWDMALSSFYLRSENYRHRTSSNEKGVAFDKVITYRGELIGKKESEVAMTIDENFLYGYVRVKEEFIFIEPLWYLNPNSPRNLYAVYNAADVIDKGGTCAANEFSEHRHHEAHEVPEVLGSEKMTCKTVEVGIASDFSMFQKYGGIAGVDAHNIGVLNNVQTNYDNEFNDELQFEVITAFTSDCNGCDPWPAGNDASALLSSFRSWGNGGGFGITDYDVAMLWTDRNITFQGNSSTVGLAYVGTVCGFSRYQVLEDFSSVAWALRVLVSHELGHNFDANHDSAGGFIMSSSVNNSNTWSGTSLSRINNYVANFGSCLSNCQSFIAPVPNFSSSNQSGCAPITVNFTDQSLNNPTSWNWTFPGGIPATSNQQNPTVNYTTAGLYPVTLEVTNPAGTNQVTVTDYVEVSEFPIADFGYIISSTSVSFQDQSVGADNYVWDFGDGNGSTLSNPIHTYFEDGTYTVILLVTNACGTETSIQQVEIITAPTAGFSVAQAQGCAPFEVVFQNESTANATNWDWNFPGGNPSESSEQFPIVTYAVPGIYDVSLTAFNVAGADVFSQSDYIEVLESASADFNFSITNQTVDFTNTSTNATSYAWDFGDGNSSILENPTHTYASDGTYIVTLISSGICGDVVQSYEVVLLSLPIAGFSADVTSGCVDLIVNFSSNSQGTIDSYNWNFPGGNPASSTDANPTVTYSSTGIYNVTLEVSNSAGTDNLVQNNFISVGTTVAADFSYSLSGTQVDFVAANNDATSYAWDFGNGTQSSMMNPSVDFENFGDYTVILTTTNNCGQEDTEQIITINTAPVPGFTFDQSSGCSPLTVSFSDQSTSNTDNWSWSFPGGTPASSTSANPTVTYNDAGSYDVSLTVSNEEGQNDLLMENIITVNSLPTGSISFTQAGNDFSFLSNAQNADSYSWDFGDGATSSSEDPSHTFASDQIYTVSLTISNACGDVTDSEIINLTTAPVAAFGATSTFDCLPGEIEFTSAASGTVTDWAWSFPGGNPASSTDENPIVQYNSAGTFDVSLTVSNSTNSNSTTSNNYITIGEAPTAGFNYTANGLTVDFNSTGNGANNYLWDFGDGNTSSASNPTYEFPTGAIYLVNLTVSNDCGEDDFEVEIDLTIAPEAGFSISSAVGCTPFEVNFQDNSSGTVDNWNWSFPGGTPASSTDANPVVTYNTPGTYAVTLEVSNANDTDSFTLENAVTVGEGPVADFSFLADVLDIDFTTTSTGAATYLWNFGDGNTSSSANPTHSYANEGIYEVSLTVSNDCGSDETVVEIDLTQAPQANFSVSSMEGCIPFEVQFSNSSTGTVNDFSWEFPGGNPATSNLENPVVTYNAIGSFDATLTVSNPVGSNTFTLTTAITTGQEPVANFNYVANLLNIDFSNSATGADTYLWDFGDGNTSSSANPSHSYTEEAIYQVSLIVSNECGTDEIIIEIDLTQAPQADFSISSMEGCIPFEVQFSNSSTGTVNNYSWEFPGGNPATSTLENPIVFYETAGSYDVTLTVSNPSNSDTFTQTNAITVADGPLADFNFNVDFLTVDFTNISSNSDSYFWDFGDGTTSVEANPIHTYAFDAIYTVTLTATNDCGEEVSEQMVNLTASPLADVTIVGTASGCPGLTVAFEDNSSGTVTNWQWTFAGGTPATSTEANPTVTYNSPGIYNVELIVSSSAGEDEIILTNAVTVLDVPVTNFSFINQSPTFEFINQSDNAESYNWNFGDGGITNVENPIHTYEADGTYEVTLSTFNECGMTSNSQMVSVTTAPSANFIAEFTEGCTPFEVEIIDQSSANVDNWSWSFPGATPASSAEQNPVITYSNPGTYDIFLTVSNSAGEVSTSRLGYIEVQSAPTASFTFAQNDNAVDFTNTSDNFSNYEWDFGDGTNSNQLNPAHTYAMSGSYEVSLMVSNDCGEESFTQTIEVNTITLPTADFAISSTQGCAPVEITFQNTSSANSESWEWSFPGGMPATFIGANPPAVTYATPGIYSVSLMVSNSQGDNTSLQSDVINILDLPDANFIVADQNALSIIFNSTADGNTDYAWNFGDGNSSTDPSPTHIYAMAGTYQVALTATNMCGTISSTLEVEVSELAELPVAQFSADSNIGCLPLTVTYTDESSNVPTTWAWVFEGGTPATSTDQNPVVIYELPGIFQTTLTVQNDTGEDMVVENGFIEILPMPTADFTFAAVGSGEIAFSNASTFADSYSWDFGDGSTFSSEAEPTHIFENSGIYEVTLIASNDCGSIEITQSVEVVLSGLIDFSLSTTIDIYPNPTAGIFTLSINGNVKPGLRMEIMDVLGKIQLRQAIPLQSNLQEQINISHLPGGTYMIKISDDNSTTYRKIILSK